MFLLNLVKIQFRDHLVVSVLLTAFLALFGFIFLQILELKPLVQTSVTAQRVTSEEGYFVDKIKDRQEGSVAEEAGSNGVVIQPSASGVNTIGAYRDVDSLLADLKLTTKLDIDYTAISNLIVDSPNAFDVLVQEYIATKDPNLKHRLEEVLGYLEHPKKTQVALQFVTSQHSEERLLGYHWLMYSEELYDPEVGSVLIDALSDPDAADLYSWIVSELPSNILFKNEHKKYDLLSQLKAFSYSSNLELAKTAIQKSAEISTDADMLNQLHDHMSHGEESIQILAIQILSRFDDVNDAIIVDLNSIMNDPYSSQMLRKQTVQTIIALENSGIIFP